MPSDTPKIVDHKILIIGAGFSGLCAAIRFSRRQENDYVIIEKRPDVGGTWWDNRYPGVACDVPSHLYSYSFERKYKWPETYSAGHVIQGYLRHTAEKYGILSKIQFDTQMDSAAWKEGKWHVTLSDGTVVRASYLISCAGGLHNPKYPDIKGQDSFQGQAFHTARWPKDADLSGKRVCMIGNAASAVQVAPAIAEKVENLTIFQRTPNWIVPRQNRQIPSWMQSLFQIVPGLQMLYRGFLYALLESNIQMLNPTSRRHQKATEMARRNLESHVSDPSLRAKLAPSYPIGCKRVLVSDDYYPTLTRSNVSLITDAVTAVVKDGVKTADGAIHKCDVIIYATGFDALNPSSHLELIGTGGVTLAEAWKDHVYAYRTMMVPGFPNFFQFLGPNSGLGHNSIILMIESQADYVSNCLDMLDRSGHDRIEPSVDATQKWNDNIQSAFANTVFLSCKSWYLDDKGRNYTIWPWGTPKYFATMKDLNAQDLILGHADASHS